MPSAPAPVGTFLITVPAFASMTLTSPEPWFVMKRRLPFASYASLLERWPSVGMRRVTLFVLRSTARISFVPMLAT